MQVARGNQWQGWPRLNRLEENVLTPMVLLTIWPALLSDLANVGPALWRWATHVASRRTDWLAAVKPGNPVWGRATYQAVLVEVTEGRQAAVTRAEELLGIILATGVPGSLVDPDQSPSVA